MGERIKLSRAVVVEGRYDAAKLAGIVDATIILTDGFGIYTNRSKQLLLKKLASTCGLLILTDSDAAGFRIRNYITNLVGAEHVVQAYVPAVAGKERRKAAPGKEGLLGVEGIDDETIRTMLQTALEGQNGIMPAKTNGRMITYTDLYEWGLSGTADSADRRISFLKAQGLPPRLSKKAMLDVLNTLYTYEDLAEQVNHFFSKAE